MRASTIRSYGLRFGVCMLALILASACADPGAGPGPGGKGNDHVLIAEVYPNGHAEDGADQFIRLYNPTDQPVDVSAWSIGDLKVRAIFPDAARIGPRQGMYLARTVAGFRKVMGGPADYYWAAKTEPGAPPAMNGGAAFLLGRNRGAAILRDGAGVVVDAMLYGEGPWDAMPGWRGPAMKAPTLGEVIDRARDESTWTAAAPGEYGRDTDAADDWRQGHEWVDLRVYRPGQTWLNYPTYSATKVTAYATPDSAYKTVSQVVDSARKTLDLTVYDFTQVQMAEKLASAAKRGVRVRLVLEAGSLGNLYDQERYVAKVVQEAGGEVRWMVNDPGKGVPGRYVYNHAKYAVVDGKVSFVQSENLVRHGVPVDPSFGNRGWGVVVEDSQLAAYLSRVFESDWNPAYGDTLPYKPGTPLGPPPAGFVPETEIPKGNYPHPFPPVTVQGPVSVTPVIAPDHSLLETKGVIGLLRSAKQSILVEQQYIQMYCAKCPTQIF